MPSPPSRKCLIPAVLLLTVGVGWLLTTTDVIPGVDWIWVLGLAVTGFLVLFIGGIDKLTVILGPFLMICTIFSLLRQTGRMSGDIEVPCLLIVAGVLALISYFLPLGAPDWLAGDPGAGGGSPRGQSQSPVVGRVGVVESALDPQGTIAVEDAVYAATTKTPPIPEGARVRVEGYDRSFLLVEQVEVTASGPS